MKLHTSLILLLLLSASFALAQNEPAFQAIRAVAAAKGNPILERIIEISGTNGTTQPAVWKILIHDPAARQGVREYEVMGGKIISERAPLKGFTGSAAASILNYKTLNLDSQGAFAVANKAAVEARVGFDGVNYLLRTDDAQGTAIWIVDLVDMNGQILGTVEVSANTGKLQAQRGMKPTAPINENGAAPPTWPESDTVKKSGGFFGRTKDAVGKVGASVQKGTLRAAGSVQEWFTGNRTVDKQYQ